MNILGDTKITVERAQAWAAANDATDKFVELAVLYWSMAPERGVNPAVAYAQAAKETAFGRYGGVIDASFKNLCGLKTYMGGANSDPDAHQKFPTWARGIAAHLDHLALYAGSIGYPLYSTPDPRHFSALMGVAATVEELGGKWAPSPTYGTQIVEMVRAM